MPTMTCMYLCMDLLSIYASMYAGFIYVCWIYLCMDLCTHVCMYAFICDSILPSKASFSNSLNFVRKPRSTPTTSTIMKTTEKYKKEYPRPNPVKYEANHHQPEYSATYVLLLLLLLTYYYYLLTTTNY